LFIDTTRGGGGGREGGEHHVPPKIFTKEGLFGQCAIAKLLRVP